MRSGATDAKPTQAPPRYVTSTTPPDVTCGLVRIGREPGTEDTVPKFAPRRRDRVGAAGGGGGRCGRRCGSCRSRPVAAVVPGRRSWPVLRSSSPVLPWWRCVVGAPWHRGHRCRFWDRCRGRARGDRAGSVVGIPQEQEVDQHEDHDHHERRRGSRPTPCSDPNRRVAARRTAPAAATVCAAAAPYCGCCHHTVVAAAVLRLLPTVLRLLIGIRVAGDCGLRHDRLLKMCQNLTRYADRDVNHVDRRVGVPHARSNGR